MLINLFFASLFVRNFDLSLPREFRRGDPTKTSVRCFCGALTYFSTRTLIQYSHKRPWFTSNTREMMKWNDSLISFKLLTFKYLSQQKNEDGTYWITPSVTFPKIGHNFREEETTITVIHIQLVLTILTTVTAAETRIMVGHLICPFPAQIQRKFKILGRLFLQPRTTELGLDDLLTFLNSLGWI